MGSIKMQVFPMVAALEPGLDSGQTSLERMAKLILLSIMLPQFGDCATSLLEMCRVKEDLDNDQFLGRFSGFGPGKLDYNGHVNGLVPWVGRRL